MAGKRKQHTAAFKAQVALAALKGDRTINELAGQYGVHPTLIHGWKKQLVSGAEEVCETADAATRAALDKAIVRVMEGRDDAESSAAAKRAVESLRARGVDGV